MDRRHGRDGWWGFLNLSQSVSHAKLLCYKILIWYIYLMEHLPIHMI